MSGKAECAALFRPTLATLATLADRVQEIRCIIWNALE
jgi:hypothetical protein